MASYTLVVSPCCLVLARISWLDLSPASDDEVKKSWRVIKSDVEMRGLNCDMSCFCLIFLCAGGQELLRLVTSFFGFYLRLFYLVPSSRYHSGSSILTISPSRRASLIGISATGERDVQCGLSRLWARLSLHWVPGFGWSWLDAFDACCKDVNHAQ